MMKVGVYFPCSLDFGRNWLKLNSDLIPQINAYPNPVLNIKCNSHIMGFRLILRYSLVWGGGARGVDLPLFLFWALSEKP